jgi:3-methyl-2-oxobutanoate hydroxymethyltransferase
LSKWTAQRIRAAKGMRKLPCLTAYDYITAKLVDAAGIPLVLVGDSLAMTVLGYETTLPATMTEMLHHTAAVARGTREALVVADMPFLSFQVSVESAIANAGRFLKEAGADAVKIEGGALRAPTVRALVQNGIPVLGHIGITPQSIREMGGYKVQGRGAEAAEALLRDAAALSEAGVFAIVLECIPAELAEEITAAASVPTIGIGAGPHCDGQILVIHDMLGFGGDVAPKFVKRYADLGDRIARAVETYRDEVSSGVYPAKEHSY